MVSEGAAPGSSWQSWAGSRATGGERPDEDAPDEAPSAEEEVGEEEVGEEEALRHGAATDGLDVVLDWGSAFEPAAAGDEVDRDPFEPAEAGRAEADLIAELRSAGDLAAAPGDDARPEPTGATAGLVGGAELVPVSPLLPSIAGRVDALAGLLRSINHRIDGLSAASDAYRTAVTDRIDEYTETIVSLHRQSDRTAEELRRVSERLTAELRRGVTDRDEAIGRLEHRLEELAADVGYLRSAVVVDPDEVDLGPLVVEQESLAARISGLETLLGELSEVQAAAEHSIGEVRRLLDSVGERQARGEGTVAEIRTLVAAVLDTMPGSAEGSGIELGEVIESFRAEIEALKVRFPAKGPRVPATRGDLDLAVGAIADAVVERIDVDAIVESVVARLEASFEIVDDEPAAPPAPPTKETRARRPLR